MEAILELEPKSVFKYFSEIAAIPHGSGNMSAISKYCEDFAKKQGLLFVRDNANNVIIYKNATKGYEALEPIILQGHLDMVCQKTEDSSIDFSKDGIELYKEEGFLKAKNTTLGGDNGIAVAMIMSILADKTLSHPPIEAVFTTDEEIGMIGASKLDFNLLKSKRMINLDAEEQGIITVSCAGGSEFKLNLPVNRKMVSGYRLLIEIKGLTGGHSGVEIDKGRINANILLGRVLNKLESQFEYSLLTVSGGDKTNAITRASKAEIVSIEPQRIIDYLNEYLTVLKAEMSSREPNLYIDCKILDNGKYSAFDKATQKALINALTCTLNGILEMSSDIKGLVETSLNLGVLTTEKTGISMQYALRSNKLSALLALEERLVAFADCFNAKFSISGRYFPWEFKENSTLQKIYAEQFFKKFQKKAKVAAIHAGLECAVFASKIPDIDCIAIGPDMFGVHTVEEKLSIKSVKEIYELLVNTLKELK